MNYHIKKTLKQFELRPNKRLGQHFLIDEKVLQKIVEAAQLSKKDTVLEIGPGLGVLTKELIKKTKKVIAIEKDRPMAKALKETIGDRAEIIEADILKYKNLPTKNYKVVANLPYYITSPVIRLFLESKNPPSQMTILVQKEVAQRICAKPPKMSLLAISVQLYSQPKIISLVDKKSFWPQPKVDSAILKITDIKKPKINTEKFFKVVKAGFFSPRKQLVNNLARGLKIDKEEIKKILLKCRINPQIRAEGLSVQDWQRIIQAL